MEGIDKSMEERVWQRVLDRGSSGGQPEEPCRLLALTGELAACYHALAAKRGGQFRALERQLRGARSRLRSLQRFQGCRETTGKYAPPTGGVREWLDRCCHLERRLAELLDARQSDPEWGEIFGLLALEARKRCLTVLELRGNMGG